MRRAQTTQATRSGLVSLAHEGCGRGAREGTPVFHPIPEGGVSQGTDLRGPDRVRLAQSVFPGDDVPEAAIIRPPGNSHPLLPQNQRYCRGPYESAAPPLS